MNKLITNDFIYCTTLKLHRDRISFCLTEKILNVIYCIIVNNNLVYIGSTKNLNNRANTYCNAKYWINAFKSNKDKTEFLEQQVKNNNAVEIWIKSVKQNKLLSIEKRYIKKFKPLLNIQHNR